MGSRTIYVPKISAAKPKLKIEVVSLSELQAGAEEAMQYCQLCWHIHPCIRASANQTFCVLQFYANELKVAKSNPPLYLPAAKLRWRFTIYMVVCTQCRILLEKLPLLKLCERSELFNIIWLFHSFSPTRLLVQQNQKVRLKNLKHDSSILSPKSGRNDHILGKIRHCVVRAKYIVGSYFATEDEEVGRTQRK